MFHVKLYREIGRWNVLRGLRQRALPSGLPLGLKPQTPGCCASLPRLRAGREMRNSRKWCIRTSLLLCYWVQCRLLMHCWPACQKQGRPVGW